MVLRNTLALLALWFFMGCGTAFGSSASGGSSPSRPVLVTDLKITYQVAPATRTRFAYDRTINVRVKSQPQYAYNASPLQSPIVIYSHGSSKGKVNGHSKAGQEWTDVLAQNGFITVNIGHAPVENTDQLIGTCKKVSIKNQADFGLKYSGLPPEFNRELASGKTPLDKEGDCAYFQSTQYLRNRDVLAVVDRIQTDLVAAVPKLLHQWNDHLVLMGHSAGSGPVMSFAGAVRTFLDPANTYQVADQTRFSAYIALSPQSHTASPHTNGYAEDAWIYVQQPVLMITGRKDETGNQKPVARKVPYNNMPAGDKYLLWFTGNTSGHSEMVLEADYNTTKLEQQFETTEAAVVRFLDIYTRNKPNLPLDYTYLTTHNPAYIYTNLDFFSK